MIPCSHQLIVSSGAVACTRERDHGGPHEAPIGNDKGVNTGDRGGAGLVYRAAAVVVWHETHERQ